VTLPAVLTEAIEGLVLIHVPPLVALLSVIDEPTHVLSSPDISSTSGKALTVIVFSLNVVQPFVVTL
jgi:hypothetical protein